MIKKEQACSNCSKMKVCWLIRCVWKLAEEDTDGLQAFTDGTGIYQVVDWLLQGVGPNCTQYQK